MMKHILTEIWIYPVKALGGIRLNSSQVFEKGLCHDRRWMLVDENHVFMTQRDFPQLSLFKLSMQENSFRIVHEENSIALPFNSEGIHECVETVVWDDPVSTLEVSKGHSEWFSREMGTTCKLVSFPEENPRPVPDAYQIKHEQVSLADGYPLLIIGQSSLDDLNARLEHPVPMNRFRPNLVFAGGVAFEEDYWRNFSIGANRFSGVKPCARCTVPTVNQDTGAKGKEPLATLSRYRARAGKVFFGQNVLAIDHNEIREGDEISF